MFVCGSLLVVVNVIDGLWWWLNLLSYVFVFPTHSPS